MAITLSASGTWTEFTTGNPVVTIPGTPAAGDRMYVWLVWKNQTITSSGPAGWTEIAEYKDGTVASGNGTGSVTIAVYYRDWQSGDGNPTITMSGVVGVGAHVGQLWSKGAGETWDTPVFATSNWVSSAAQSVSSKSAAVPAPDGSVVMSAIAIGDDSATFTRTSTSLTGWRQEVSDDFTRADSTTSSGASWTNRTGSTGISTNQWYNPSAAGSSQVTSTHNTVASGDDAKARATLTVVGTDEHQLWFMSGGSNTSLVNATTTACFFRTQTDFGGGGQTQRITGPAITSAAGDVWSIDRVGNLYTMRRNGVSLGTPWVDSGNLHPRDSTHRACGLGNFHTAAAVNAMRWDDFSISVPIVWNGNYVESPATHYSSTTGNDMSADLGHRFVTTGSTIGADFTSEATLSAAETGAMLWVVQEVSTAASGSLVPPMCRPNYGSLLQL